MTAHLARLESVFAAQKGLVTLDQLRTAELSERRVRTLVRQNVLRKIRPRVFGLVGVPDSWTRGLLAAVLSTEEGVASHSAAARLWEFEPGVQERYEVTTSREERLAMRGVVVHRSRTLCDEDIVRRQDIPCTSFERTLCDCTTLLSESQLGRALDQGLRRGVASIRRLTSCSERLESGPGRHMSSIRALLGARCSGFDPGGSRSELNLLEVFREAGLPLPVQQHRIRVGSKTFRPDFAWPDFMVFAEYYGLPFHTGASAVEADSQRLTALSAAGWLPLVFTHVSSDGEIVDRTSAALALRGAGSERTA